MVVLLKPRIARLPVKQGTSGAIRDRSCQYFEIFLNHAVLVRVSRGMKEIQLKRAGLDDLNDAHACFYQHVVDLQPSSKVTSLEGEVPTVK